MDIDRFWQIVERSRRESQGDREQQVESLSDMLNALSIDEVASFDQHVLQCMDQSYHWNLWGAAYILGDGCSDDSFIDFRSWLISMGRRVFEDALGDAETLSDVVQGGEGASCFFEEFATVAFDMYEERTGRYPPVPLDDGSSGESDAEPGGEPWEEEGDDLQRRFPRLSKKFAADWNWNKTGPS